MNDIALRHRQDALRHVLQHGLDIVGLLPEQERAFLDLGDHRVKGDDRATDLVFALDRHPTREVLAARDFAHHRLHVADRADDLAIKHDAQGGEKADHDQRDDGDGRDGAGQARVQCLDGAILGAVFLDAQGLDDLFHFLLVLADAGKKVGLRQFRLPGKLEVRRVVDRREVVLQAFRGLRDEAALGIGVGFPELQVHPFLEPGLACRQNFLGLGHQIAVRGRNERHGRQLDILEGGDQIGRGQRAGHDTLGDAFDPLRAVARLQDGKSAD